MNEFIFTTTLKKFKFSIENYNLIIKLFIIWNVKLMK
jgi:hypothetical protein